MKITATPIRPHAGQVIRTCPYSSSNWTGFGNMSARRTHSGGCGHRPRRFGQVATDGFSACLPAGDNGEFFGEGERLMGVVWARLERLANEA